MPSPTYLMKRNGIYYARVPVPVALQKLVGKKEIWKSLKVADFREACDIMRLTFLSKNMLETLHGGNVMEPIAQPAILKIIAEHVYQVTFNDQAAFLRRHYAEAYRMKGIKGQQHYLGCHADNDLKEALEATKTLLIACDYDEERKQLGRALRGVKSIIFPVKGTAEEERVFSTILQSRMKALKALIKAVKEDDYLNIEVLEIRPLAQQIQEFIAEKTRQSFEIAKSEIGKNAKPVDAQASSIAFGDLVTEFNAAPSIKKKSMRMKQKYASWQNLLLEAIGEKTPVNKISVRFVEESLIPALEYVPKSWARAYPNKSFKEIVAIETRTPSQHPKYAAPTKNGFIGHLDSLMRFAERYEYNPPSHDYQHLYFKDEILAKNKRDPFSYIELNNYLRHKRFVELKDNFSEAHYYWVPLISFFTGMRMSEPLMMPLSEVKSEDGIWYFDITPHELRSIKTKQSLRRVPIPKILMSLGFMDYVEKVRKLHKEKNRLFPFYEVTYIPNPGGKFSTRFSRELKRMKIKRANLSFHSSRHFFNDLIRNSKLRPELERIAVTISGWTEGNARANYGLGYSIQNLVEAMDTIDFSKIEIAHLKPSRNHA